MEQHIADLNAEDLASTAWAFAKAERSDSQLFALLARMAEERARDFNVRNLADTACAFAMAGIQKPKMMQKFGARASVLMEQFDPESLQRFLRAYEEAGGKDESWAKAIGSQRVRKYMFPSISLDVPLFIQAQQNFLRDRLTDRSVG